MIDSESLRDADLIKSETKPDRFLKPVRFGSKVSEVIKSSLLIKEESSHFNNLTDFQGHVILSESERTRTEIWTRVMGYHRPVSAFNPGKKSEHAERLHFKEE